MMTLLVLRRLLLACIGYTGVEPVARRLVSVVSSPTTERRSDFEVDKGTERLADPVLLIALLAAGRNRAADPGSSASFAMGVERPIGQTTEEEVLSRQLAIGMQAASDALPVEGVDEYEVQVVQLDATNATEKDANGQGSH